MPQGKSKHVITYTASAAPEDAHLGYPISLLGSTLSYDRHVCHPRNERDGERRGRAEQLQLGPAEEILIERSEELVCQLPCRNNTPFLHPECTDSRTHAFELDTPPFTTSAANAATPKGNPARFLNRTEVVNKEDIKQSR